MILATHQVHLLEDAQKILVMDEGKIVERGSYEQINRETENGEESVNEDESGNTKSVIKSEEEKSESIDDESDTNQDQSESNHERLESSQDLLESNQDESDLKQDQFESYDLSNRSSFAKLQEIVLEKKPSRIHSISVYKNQSNRDMSSPKKLNTREISTSQLIQRQKSIVMIHDEPDANDEYVNEPVTIKDWLKLFSFGIGNFFFIVLILLCLFSNYMLMT